MSTQTVSTVLRPDKPIGPPSELWRQNARVHLEPLTKPLGCFSRLQDLASQRIAICNENAEGVSAHSRQVTYQMLSSFLWGGAAVKLLTRLDGSKVHVSQDTIAVPDMPTFESAIAPYTPMARFTSLWVSKAS